MQPTKGSRENGWMKMRTPASIVSLFGGNANGKPTPSR